MATPGADEPRAFLSVTVPAYNEAENLPELHRRIVATLDGLGASWKPTMRATSRRRSRGPIPIATARTTATAGSARAASQPRSTSAP